MTVMLWRLDADDIAGALEIARYAMTYGLTMPTGGHRRTTPYLLAEEVALSAQRLLDAKQPVGLPLLLDTIALTERADMPDIVRAKLHKITGYVLREAGRLTDALTHLQRAIQLERAIGVKKDIEQLERALKPKAEPAPKQNKPRTRKPAANRRHARASPESGKSRRLTERSPSRAARRSMRALIALTATGVHRPPITRGCHDDSDY